MGLLDFLKKEAKAVPAVTVTSEETRGGLHKAYIPEFLYKPPFGYPRFVDLVTVRRLAATPYVEMCISTILDEVCAVPWDIVPKEGKEGPAAEAHAEEVKNFYLNPNTNKESFESLRRKYLRDILEIDSGIINKVFNVAGQMVEMVARDGATFTKNPDIYGMMTDREDLIDGEIMPDKKPKITEVGLPGFITAADAREKAAYFQYGWIAGARPVPFGKREVVWFERNPRTDNIYGRSPIQNLAETIQTLIYAIEHNLEYFNDNSIPKGILGLEGSNSEEIIAFKEAWEEQQRKKDGAGNWKKKFHNMPIVGKMPKFERLQLTNAEMELLAGQQWWAKLVWACFGVTSVELGYSEDAKGMANQIVQSNVFKKRAINPMLRLEEFKHNQEIINEFEFDDVELKFLQFDVDEEMKKAQLYEAQIRAGYKSINEVRVEEGMDEVDWGEKESEEDRFNRENSFFEGGSMEQEENNEKKKVNNSKENMQPSKKAELKYKYVKRTGTSGHYQYWYRTPGGKLIAGKKPEPKKSDFDKAYERLEEIDKHYDAVWDDNRAEKITDDERDQKLKDLNKIYDGERQELIGKMLNARETPNKEIKPYFGEYGIVQNAKLEPNNQGHFEEIAPEEFYEYAPEKSGGRYVFHFRSLKKVKDYVEKTGRLSVGYLEITNGKVTGHEGRHTTAVARIFGIKKMSVYVTGSDHASFGKGVKKEYKRFENNPLILRENEVPEEDRLQKSIVYVLEENKKKIKALLEKEYGKDKLNEIKSVEDVTKSIEGILTFEGLKEISDQVIKATFSKGWDSAEKQLERNMILNPGAMNFIQTYTFDNIKGMTVEIMNDLKAELSRGIMEGEGIAKIKARVEKVFNVGANRAEMIARTETNRAENQGKLQAFKASGETLLKKWDAHLDNRTSEICNRLDGKVVGLNENFKDGPSGWEGPCPPSHVNCRSAILYIDKKEMEQKAKEDEAKLEKLKSEEIDLKLKEKELQIKEGKAKLLKRLEEDHGRSEDLPGQGP